MKCFCRKTTVIIFSLLTLFNVYSETFRVSKTQTVDLSLDTESTVSVGVSEALAIFLPEEKTFIEGIDIKMTLPEEIAEWTDCVACSVYDSIKPIPSSSQIDYTATRKYVRTLPGKLSWFFQIPLLKNDSIKTDKYTTKMDTIPDLEQNVILLRLQPVMKGLPDDIYSKKITMSVKPILSNKGQLELNIMDGEEYVNCTLYIDDALMEYTKEKNKYLLTPGVHNISIIAESYRNELRTVMINQAKTTNLVVNLNSAEPTIFITAPQGSVIYLDNEKITAIGKEIEITSGEHKISFSIGNYQLTRTITAVKGKKYTANFNVDLEISEE